jgi:hypothetical protein
MDRNNSARSIDDEQQTTVGIEGGAVGILSDAVREKPTGRDITLLTCECVDANEPCGDPERTTLLEDRDGWGRRTATRAPNALAGAGPGDAE